MIVMIVIVAMMLVRIEAKCFWNCTQQPSLRPSPGPTIVPTPVPTNFPTLSPSSIPTLRPSSLPTNLPTLSLPTNLPTLRPSSEPTVEPTLSPSYVMGTPTPRPTYMPSLSPTHPTRHPTLEPTHPTTHPTHPTTQPSSQPTKDYGNFSYRKLKKNIKYSLTRDWSKYLLVAVIFIIISVSIYCYQSYWNMRSRYEYIAIPDRHDAAVQAVDIEYNQQYIQNSTAPPEAEMVMTSFQRLFDESDRHNAGVDIEYNQQYIQNSTAPPEAEMVILSVLPAVRTSRNQSRSFIGGS